MAFNLRYLGADKSPFVPQTPRELTVFRAEFKEVQKQRLERELARREERSSNSRVKGGRRRNWDSQLHGLLCGKVFKDRLSIFFAADNCFNKDIALEDESRVDWPTLAELKEEGDKRASKFGRYFPLPRLNAVATRILEQEGDDAFNEDGSIRWDKKAVKLGSCDLLPVSPSTESTAVAAPQISIQELPAVMQQLLQEIDDEKPEIF